MPRIEDVVRISHRGGSPVPDPSKELDHGAYCLYEAVKAELIRSGCQEVTRDSITGYEGPVSVPNLFGALWPSLARSRGGEESEEAKKARTALYDYLRDSSNLVCIRPGNRNRMSVWWARAIWNAFTGTPSESTVEANGEHPPQQEIQPPPILPSPPLQSAVIEDAELSNTTALVTKMTVVNPDGTLSCQICGADSTTFQRQNSLSKHIFTSHIDLNQLIVSVLEQYGEGASAADVKELLASAYDYEGGLESVRRRLVELSRLDNSAVTQRDGPINTHLYYFTGGTSATMPQLKQQEQEEQQGYLCREPGCNERFPHTATRIRHEQDDHGNSPWQVWECPICSVRAYNRLAWATHVTVTHRISSESPEYKIMVTAASSGATQRRRLLEAETAINSVPVPAPVAVVPVIPAAIPAAVEPEPDTEPESESEPVGLIESVTNLIRERNQLLAENTELRARVAELESSGSSVLIAENNKLKQEIGQLQQLFKQLR
jgi:hypothetical protein